MDKRPTFVLCMAGTKEEFDAGSPEEVYELNTIQNCIDEAARITKDFPGQYYAAYVVAEDGSNPWKQIYEKKALLDEKIADAE